MRISAAVNEKIRTLPELVKIDSRDMRAIVPRVDSRFRKNEQRLFSTEGASGGERWQPLSPRYAKWKRRHYPGRRILTLSGDLRRSLTQRAADHIAYGYSQPRATVVVGTANKVGVYHAPGPLHNPKLPVRDPIQQTGQQIREYTGAIRDYFVQTKLSRIARVLRAARLVAREA